MKKVLVFSKSFYPLSETFIHKQVIALTKSFSVTMMAFRFPNGERFPTPGTGIVQLQYFNNQIDRLLTFVARKLFRFPLPFSLATIRQLKKIIGTGSIDVIHAHYGWNGIAILPFAKRFNIPLVVSFHGKDASASLKKKKYRRQLLPLFEYSASIILCSPYMRHNLPLADFEDKVAIVPYGVDATLFAPPFPDIENTILRIVHAGRIVKKKGVPDVIRVFAKLHKRFPLTELQIIGEGEELEECKSLVLAEQLEDSVIFFGAQSHEFVRKTVIQGDIFILNSRTDDSGDQEGLPNALLEAMSCGKPVISTLHAGIPDAVCNNINGLLVVERNNAELYDALERLVLDDELRKQLGKNARETILKSFTMPLMERALMDVMTKAERTYGK